MSLITADMFSELIKALEAMNLKPGDTIGLKKLCECSGLSVSRFGWVLDSNSCAWMLAEDLNQAGFDVRYSRRGKRKCFEFCLLTE